MSELELDCEMREELGSGAARRMRARGFVPGIIYGHEKKPEAVAVSASDFHRLYAATGGHAAVLTLCVRADDRVRRETAIIKQVRRQATTDRILNIDFQRVSPRERVRVRVRVVLTGTAAGVDQGGVLGQATHELEVECSAAHIPESLEADVTQITIGDVLTAADVRLPERVVLLTHSETVVATVVPPRVEEEAPAAPPREPELITRRAEEEEKT